MPRIACDAVPVSMDTHGPCENGNFALMRDAGGRPANETQEGFVSRFSNYLMQDRGRLRPKQVTDFCEQLTTDHCPGRRCITYNGPAHG